MIVGIGSLSLLLLGGAVAVGSLVATANSNSADRVQIDTSDDRNDDQRDDRNELVPDADANDPSNPNSSSQPSSKPRSVDVDNNGAVALDDATIAAISKAALAAAGGSGTVTDIDNEQGSNRAYAYEVEVERADRSEVTVYLDASYKVVKVVEDNTWD